LYGSAKSAEFYFFAERFNYHLWKNTASSCMFRPRFFRPLRLALNAHTSTSIAQLPRLQPNRLYAGGCCGGADVEEEEELKQTERMLQQDDDFEKHGHTAASTSTSSGVVKTMSDLHVTRPNREEVEQAVRTLIRWAGDDPSREGLLDTPSRVARAYEEFFVGYRVDPKVYLEKTFEEIENYDEMIVLKDIRLESYCEVRASTACMHAT
jgi:hypothetical protein